MRKIAINWWTNKSFSFQNSKDIQNFNKKGGKGSKKKGKKGIKWDKSNNQGELLGFEHHSASPFDFESGYNLNELDLMHFKAKSFKKKNSKNKIFSTAQHVQANHRFILKPNKERNYFYATYDPDYIVEWDDIFMVLAKRNVGYLCPICRDEEMVVPMIGPWGHIFWYTWILQYFLHSTDSEGEGWRKCPLCEELVFKKTLKFVQVSIKPPPKENDTKTFKLAFRNQCSNIVKYYEETDNKKRNKSKFENLEVFYHSSPAYNITRIRVCQEFGDIFQNFQHQLTESWKESENLGDTLLVSLCQEAKEAIESLEKEIQEELEQIYQQRSLNVNNMDEIDQSEGQSFNSFPDNININKITNKIIWKCLADTQKYEKFEKIVKESKGNFYFYQLEDETHTFLDPLCMRILLREYGSYDNLPLKISSNILEIEELNMNEQLRHKYRPIAHLGLSAEFKFIELDMSNLVSYKNYEHFEKQIRGKENLRKRRQTQENLYNEKAKLIEEKKHEYYMRNNLEVNRKSKSRYVPEWDAEENIKEDTWFTLDGKEIKGQKQKSNQAWANNHWNNEENEEIKQEIEEEKENWAKNEELNTKNNNNVWDEFEIHPKEEKIDEFPILGRWSPQKEKIPIIVSKIPSKSINKTQNLNKKIQKDSNNDSGGDSFFTIEQFIVKPQKRRKNKRKGKR